MSQVFPINHVVYRIVKNKKQKKKNQGVFYLLILPNPQF